MANKSDKKGSGSTYQAPVPPKPGYRRGFEPRPGESDSQRLKREMEELMRRQENKKRYGATYEHYPDQDIYAEGGKVQTSADTARKLATEMGGMKDGGAMKPVDSSKNPGLSKLPSEVRNKMGYMKKGGKPKSGLAVMIAIGAPMKGEKKPVKKMGGGMMYANGGKPDKFAQGGAGKVRKGMMTPEGKIIHAMNKVRGK
jgi:hypothetical protein